MVTAASVATRTIPVVLVVALALPGAASGQRSPCSIPEDVEPSDPVALSNLRLECEAFLDTASLSSQQRAVALKSLAALIMGSPFWSISESAHRAASNAAREAARLDPDDATIWWTVGYTARFSGEYRVAVEAYRRHRDVNPADTAALVAGYVGEGRALSGVGDHQGAAESYRAAIELDALNAPAWSELGFELMSTEDMQEACNAWRVAVGLNPDDGFARTLLNAAVSTSKCR